MNNNIAIRVENLGKQFHIGALKKNRNFREALVDGLKAPFRRATDLLRGKATGAAELDETFWALRDVSFEIRPGEAVGVIGGNGAGKSTLLKIISRITEPSEGFADIHGRMGSLLEVGTGFHAELSGRENIFLNGAILGMKKTEIKRKFDEIIDFSGVDKFIDTPVKHYSSGMYLRLAFAVAANLDPEIMIVDEVLAVGDAKFQKKCLNKMSEVRKEGRTVLFVSHNMMAITRLCDRAILIEQGTVRQDGPSEQVVSAYLGIGFNKASVQVWPDEKAPGGEIVRLHAVRVLSEDGHIIDTVNVRHPVVIEIEYNVLKPGYSLQPSFQFSNEEGICLFSTHDVDPEWQSRPRSAARYLSSVRIPGNLLAAGTIFVSTGLETTDPNIYQYNLQDIIAFNVIESYEKDTARGDFKGHIAGAVRPLLQWSTKLGSRRNTSSTA